MWPQTGKGKIHWSHLRLGLCQAASPPINAQLHWRRVHWIRASPPREDKTHHIHTPPKIWRHKTIRYGRRWVPQISATKIKIHPTHRQKFNFIARAVDGTMQSALSSLATEHATPSANIMKKLKQFLDYAASQEELARTYKASDMVLVGHRDGSYLSKRNARSRTRGH